VGYLPERLLRAIADELALSPVEVYEVASFYHHFELVRQGADPPPALTLRICDSVSCALSGAQALLRSLQATLGGSVRVQSVSCVGRCAGAPVAVVGSNPLEHATIGRIRRAIEASDTRARAPQIQDYLAYRTLGGYQRLAALANDPSEEAIASLIEELDQADLRGLGGAGFPAGRKWRIVRSQPGARLMAVNIDEGEPGTFKDRCYLERQPHRFLEGALIAARAIGADALFLYLRDEYAGCREMLVRELAKLQADPPCPLPSIHLRRGAGAYICGEESAMLESIEGKRGMPRLRPPYVAERGLFDRPTLVHNLETLYWLPEILDKGAAWFSSHGRHGGKGLRSFCVSGRVRNPGAYLAPVGITARELINEFCGGMQSGQRLKAYFPGGASGGILPASLSDLPLAFGSLEEYGCSIGSAALIVLAERDSVRDAAVNVMRFFAHESCGRCTPCRVGTAKAAQLMGRASWDRPLLEELAAVMQDASICGLGQAAANPLLCAMRYFPGEFGL